MQNGSPERKAAILKMMGNIRFRFGFGRNLKSIFDRTIVDCITKVTVELTMGWDGSQFLNQVVGWVGLGVENWTHGHV